MTANKNDKVFNEMMMHSATKNSIPYASIDTPNGQFRIYPEMEEGYHGAFITFVRDGQTVEQDICMAEINPDNPKEFSVKVWSEPRSEEYQEEKEMTANKNNKVFNEMLMHSATKNSVSYA